MSGTGTRSADHDAFRLTKGDAAELGAFKHRTLDLTHYFCRECSSNLYCVVRDKVGANVRTFDGVDVQKLDTEFFDGRNLL